MSAPTPIEQPATLRAATTDKGLFADRDFLCLWLVSIVHNLGEKLFFVFLIFLADRANHSNSLVSAISIASAVPAILFGSLAGVFVDRFPLKHSMVVSSLARALFVLALPFAGSMIWPLLGFAFGFGFLTRFFDPAFMKAVPTVVPKRHLMAANSVFMTTMVAALIGSFALAGPLWKWATYQNAHLVVCGLYTVAALVAAFIRFPAVAREETRQPNFWAEWRFAFSYLKRHPRLMKAYTMTMTLFGCFAALNVIAKGFTFTALGTESPTDFTNILAFAGLGMVAGALAVGRWGWHVPKPLLVRAGFTLGGLALLALAVVGLNVPFFGVERAWNVVFALATLVGVGGACIEIPIATFVQEGVAEEVRGRIFGVQAMLMNLASTLPMAIAGPLADLWGPAVVMGLMGVLMGSMAFIRLSDAIKSA